MKRAARTSLLAAGVLFATHSLADEECIPNIVDFDVCEHASMIQQEVAPTLPMPVNGNMTLQHVLASGPRLSVVIVWHIENANVERGLTDSGLDRSGLAEMMDEHAYNMACGQEVLAAFVRLGGQIEYVYRTIDAHPVHAPIVEHCPPRAD
jgi:hypothetical protein